MFHNLQDYCSNNLDFCCVVGFLNFKQFVTKLPFLSQNIILDYSGVGVVWLYSAIALDQSALSSTIDTATGYS